MNKKLKLEIEFEIEDLKKLLEELDNCNFDSTKIRISLSNYELDIRRMKDEKGEYLINKMEDKEEGIIMLERTKKAIKEIVLEVLKEKGILRTYLHAPSLFIHTAERNMFKELQEKVEKLEALIDAKTDDYVFEENKKLVKKK